MFPLLVSYSDQNGGAARATWRLHQALLAHDVESRMSVMKKISDDWRVIGPDGKFGKGLGLIRPLIGNSVMRLQKTHNTVFHSASILYSGNKKSINKSDADVVNLHWVCNETLSIEEIGRIDKPVVWTLHDMWAFCGAEHYANEDSISRYIKGYHSNNRNPGHGGLDIDRWTWKRKIRAWRNPMTIITPSNWLAECASQSVVMRDWPVHVVPHSLNTDMFRPYDKDLCREILGLPKDVPLILFGAIDGAKDPRKGFDLLTNALSGIQDKMILQDAQCIVFGQGKPELDPNIGYPVHWIGHLYDDWSLVLLYNAADVMVVPSRMEAFGQTASEAHACGTPVVAFNCTGLQDVVKDRISGYLAEPYSHDDLANGIEWVLHDSLRYTELCNAARMHAIQSWTPEIVVPQYLKVYENAIAMHNT